MSRRQRTIIILTALILALFATAMADDLLNMEAPAIVVENLDDAANELADDGDEESGKEVYALFLTNIKNAQDGLGTWRYTLALPTDERIDESNFRLASMAELSRRLIDLDGSMGDPMDADILQDIAATVDCGYADAYAVFVADHVIHIFRNGENVLSEPLNKYYTGIIYTKNKRGVPALRYTRKDGTTALIQFSHECVVLFTGEFEKLYVSYGMDGSPIAFGAGCMVEFFRANSRIIMHNSGLVEESEYPPGGIQMLGIAYDEEANPVTIDSGMFLTGPRPTRGRICVICRKEYNSKKPEQAEWHFMHECEHPGCMYGGYWASCAPEGSLYHPALHGPSPNCPYSLCAVCSPELCYLCKRDLGMK